MLETLAAITLVIWLYLALGRGGFWRCSERDDWPSGRMDHWPAVAVVVPARNEADQIGASVASVLEQDYAGPCTVILVDDGSSDGTADVAWRTLPAGEDPDRLRIATGRPLPTGW